MRWPKPLFVLLRDAVERLRAHDTSIEDLDRRVGDLEGARPGG